MRRLAWFSLLPGLVWLLVPAIFSGGHDPVGSLGLLLPVTALVAAGFVALHSCPDPSRLPARVVLLWLASGLVVMTYRSAGDLTTALGAFALATPLTLFWIVLPLLAETTLPGLTTHQGEDRRRSR